MNTQTTIIQRGRQAPPEAPSTLAPPALPPVRPPRVPERIGHYTVLGLLGEGGMGTVFLGEQREPFYRRVAVKVIRAGRASVSYALRFEHERQILALMSHQGIARVYDAGTTEEGDPWFAMEYVPGLPLTEFCDRERLTTRERLELFVEVCDAIQHAHQRGVLHRDIKPHNVLVTREDGRARVIDFGLAKAFDSPLRDVPELTQLGFAVGTPSYMSPEQADRRLTPDIDSRADVYSLGVLLYELLTGYLPLELGQDASFVERLLKTEPPPPSRRVSALGNPASEIASRRRSGVPELRRQLSGDLDWIVLRALEKDRERRYTTVSEMAEDVRRHLRDELVLAGPPSWAYRLRKLARRNKLATAALILMVLGLAAGTAGVAAGLVRSLRAEEQARREADTALAINRMLDEMLASAAPGQGGRDVRVVDVLDRAAGRMARERLEPGVEAGLRATLGRTYLALGHFDKAGPQLESARALYTRALGPEAAGSPEVLAVRLEQVRWLFETGRGADAEREARDLVTRARAALGPEHTITLRALGRLATVLGERGRWDEAVGLIRELIAIQERTLGAGDRETLQSHNVLARLLVGQGRPAEAESAARRAYEGLKALHGEAHPDVLSSMNTLAGALFYQDKLADLEQLTRRGVEIRVRTLGREHPETLDAMNNLGSVLSALDRTEEAEAVLRETLKIRRRVLGAEHPRTLDSMSSVADVLAQRGDLAGAQAIFAEVWEKRLQTLGKDDPETWLALSRNAGALDDLGRHGEAAKLRARAFAELKRILGPDHPVVRDLSGRGPASASPAP